MYRFRSVPSSHRLSRRLAPRAAALLLVLIPAVAGTARAQEATTDSTPIEAVPPDTVTTIYQAALSLEAEGERELAEALFDYIVRRWPESGPALAIRAVWAREGSLGPAGDGRTELVVWGTLYGLWLGVAVPGMAGVDDEKALGGGLLVGGPLGYWISSGRTRSVPIGAGNASAITWGSTWGTWQGFGWAHVLDLGSECTTAYWGGEYCTGPSSEAVLRSMVGAGIVGAVTGAAIGRNRTISAGRASMASLGSLWGTWFGAAAAGLLDVDGGDRGLGWTLMGGNVGLLAGALARPGDPLTRNRARIASVIGLAGGLAGVGLVLMLDPGDDRIEIAVPLVGSVVGLLAGIGVTRDGVPAEQLGARPASVPSGASWTVGGPVTPTVVEVRGERRPALSLTLLSARF